ncbi:putative GPI-anchored protein pfl2 [Drosophila novamexicana]|uniref:putative GPI-anchored protein pfl2 n=1 Tax=Drosophila novamexicana TaxID=47314 RepID=UPI0011E5AD5B|nr:putative GPI-anchored protein pfl2 [Drosophila novamexicana]
MANGNGNNINTDDAAAAAAAAATTTAQEQQHLTGDGSGACGDVKLPASARGSNVNDLVADLWLNGSGSSSNRGDYTNIRATTGAAATASAATVTATATTSATLSSNVGSSTSTSTFSFKHFLNSSGTIIAPSSTVTSLDPAVGPSSNSAGGCSSSNTSVTAPATSTSLQTSTGARPKVPQSASVSHMQPDLNGSAASKMKRSPRFSSFDSQASLAEYAACGGGTGGSSGSGTRLRPDLRLEVERSGVMLDCDDDYDHVGLAQVRNSRLYDERADDDIFPSAASNLHASASSSRYVPRSYSSYDMPPQAACAAASPRRRAALRPNRLVLSSAAKMKLDLPLDASNVAGAASALPDFVQDHLPDAWCQEAHLSSPPNSPLGAAEAPSCSGAMGGGSLLLPAAVAAGLPSVSTLAATVGEAAGSTGKMLPDFLSDGPILHSSQRLADVAIGLPSNSIDSPPQEADAGTSTLRQENERLQRELQEIRVELNVQTRRAQEFEQQLLALADARRRETLAATAQTQTTQRLRRQVAQLEADLFELRGSSDQVSGGAAAAAAAGGASVMTPGSSHSSSSNTSRPSRTHQLSRDLLRAADNAEQNLRQLLAGVDNLRQMAASLEQPTAPAATPRSPNSDSYTDFN